MISGSCQKSIAKTLQVCRSLAPAGMAHAEVTVEDMQPVSLISSLTGVCISVLNGK